MNDFHCTPQAGDDLFEIWSYVAADSVDATDRVEAAILAACNFLAGAPLCGRYRRDLTEHPLRFWTVPRFPSYIVAYNPATQPLQIIRILHGKRDLRRLFQESPS